jgi:enoyl-CoA hydratase/carnithine racemase
MDILCELRNHIAFITLNRPAALNALSYEMVLDLDRQLRAYAADPDVRAVLIKGAGEKAFCAGGDVRALYQSAVNGGNLHHEFFRDEYRLDQYLHEYPKPYIALMSGITMGGGMGIAQGSKLRVVTDRTRIAMPEVGIGLFPDVGGSYFLSRLPGAIGTYLALTGNPILAADAIYAQLADVYVPSASLPALEQALAELRWSNDSRGDLSAVVHRFASTDLPPAPLAALRPAIDAHFAHDTVPAIMRSLQSESRPEYAEWAQQTRRIMSGRSPTMMAVTLRQLQRGKTLALADCFSMELRMVQHCFVQGDFIEGVRALLIDKDNSPRWNPPTLDAVSEAMVDAFFAPPPPDLRSKALR